MSVTFGKTWQQRCVCLLVLVACIGYIFLSQDYTAPHRTQSTDPPQVVAISYALDAAIADIFRVIGITNGFFVQFGSSDTLSCNTHMELTTQDSSIPCHQGLYFNVRFRPRNITEAAHVLSSAEAPRALDYIAIDLDSTDIWIFEELLTAREGYRPRVVSIEFNPNFPLESTVAFRPDIVRRPSGCLFGSSLGAVRSAATRAGYTIVHVADAVHAVLIRSDLAAGKLLAASAKELAKHTGRPFLRPEHDVRRLKQYLDYRNWTTTRDEHAAVTAGRLQLQEMAASVPCLAAAIQGEAGENPSGERLRLSSAWRLSRSLLMQPVMEVTLKACPQVGASHSGAMNDLLWRQQLADALLLRAENIHIVQVRMSSDVCSVYIRLDSPQAPAELTLALRALNPHNVPLGVQADIKWGWQALSETAYRLPLSVDWSGAWPLTPLAAQIRDAQSSCERTHSVSLMSVGLGASYHIWSQALCNALEQNMTLTIGPGEWPWRDPQFCPEEGAEHFSCYFPGITACLDDGSRSLPYNWDVQKGFFWDSTPNHCEKWMPNTWPQPFPFLHAFRAASVEYLFSHLSPRLLHLAEKAAFAVFGPAGVPKKLITVHIRWGDKAIEMNLKPIAEYIRAVQLLIRDNRIQSPSVYIITEDKRALGAFLEEAPSDWSIFTYPAALMITKVANASDPAQSPMAGASESSGALGTESMIGLLLGMEGRYFVLTTRSNWSQLINELRTHILEARCQTWYPRRRRRRRCKDKYWNTDTVTCTCTDVIDLSPQIW
eukprot:gene6670-7985_t